jgi:hypothetical protein
LPKGEIYIIIKGVKQIGKIVRVIVSISGRQRGTIGVVCSSQHSRQSDTSYNNQEGQRMDLV